MSEPKIEQIKLFHSLKLQPISKNEVEKWCEKVNRDLLSVYCIKDCFVNIENMTTLLPTITPPPSPVSSTSQLASVSSGMYELRKNPKKKASWCMC